MTRSGTDGLGIRGRGRETVEQKAHRLLVTGAVRAVDVAETGALVVVAGDTGRYEVELSPGRSTCSCPATVARCSHVIAAELIARLPDSEDAA